MSLSLVNPNDQIDSALSKKSQAVISTCIVTAIFISLITSALKEHAQGNFGTCFRGRPQNCYHICFLKIYISLIKVFTICQMLMHFKALKKEEKREKKQN